MKRFYIINKRPGDKTGKVLSGHKTFEAAQKALERIQRQVNGEVPVIIIELEKTIRIGHEISPADYSRIFH